jgi:hypothetical protein
MFNGNFVTSFDFEAPLVNGRDVPDFIEVIQNGMYGIIDKNGDIIVPFVFEHILAIDEHRAFAKYEGAYGIISVTGVMPTEYLYGRFYYQHVRGTMDYSIYYEFDVYGNVTNSAWSLSGTYTVGDADMLTMTLVNSAGQSEIRQYTFPRGERTVFHANEYFFTEIR